MSTHWACSVCTYSNASHAAACAMCATARPPAPAGRAAAPPPAAVIPSYPSLPAGGLHQLHARTPSFGGGGGAPAALPAAGRGAGGAPAAAAAAGPAIGAGGGRAATPVGPTPAAVAASAQANRGGAAVSTWSCSACTYSNALAHERCFVCGHDRPAFVPVAASAPPAVAPNASVSPSAPVRTPPVAGRGIGGAVAPAAAGAGGRGRGNPFAAVGRAFGVAAMAIERVAERTVDGLIGIVDRDAKPTVKPIVNGNGAGSGSGAGAGAAGGAAAAAGPRGSAPYSPQPQRPGASAGEYKAPAGSAVPPGLNFNARGSGSRAEPMVIPDSDDEDHRGGPHGDAHADGDDGSVDGDEDDDDEDEYHETDAKVMSSQSTWLCNKCTFVNGAHLGRCAMCAHAPDGTLLSTDDPDPALAGGAGAGETPGKPGAAHGAAPAPASASASSSVGGGGAAAAPARPSQPQAVVGGPAPSSTPGGPPEPMRVDSDDEANGLNVDHGLGDSVMLGMSSPRADGDDFDDGLLIPDTWACASCTFHNAEQSADSCALCQCARPKEEVARVRALLKRRDRHVARRARAAKALREHELKQKAQQDAVAAAAALRVQQQATAAAAAAEAERKRQEDERTLQALLNAAQQQALERDRLERERVGRERQAKVKAEADRAAAAAAAAQAAAAAAAAAAARPPPPPSQPPPPSANGPMSPGRPNPLLQRSGSRAGAHKLIAPAASEWDCAFCTLRNTIKANNCVACNRPKPPPPPVPPASPAAPAAVVPARSPSIGGLRPAAPAPVVATFWTCQRCTVQNPLNITLCDVCSLPRPPASAPVAIMVVPAAPVQPPPPPPAPAPSPPAAARAVAAAAPAAVAAAAAAAVAGDAKARSPSMAAPAGAPLTAEAERKQRHDNLIATEYARLSKLYGGDVVARDWLVTGRGQEARSKDAQNALHQYEEIQSVCSAAGNSFVDTDFRPDNKSLYGESGLSAADGRGMGGGAKGATLAWRRATETKKDGGAAWAMIRGQGADALNSRNILQGALGDCWFLSALSVLCERPELVRHCILTPTINATGCYQMRFCRNGLWTTVTIDDYLPVDEWGRPAYSKCKGNELWAPLLEKAYAKLYGSYAAISSGHMHEALADLTGAPCDLLDFDAKGLDTDMMWAQLLSYHASGFLMGASCGGTQYPAELYEKHGLQKNHAYAVLRVADAMDDTGKTHRLVKLRNPWGSGEWKGKWSDGDSKSWTPKLKRDLAYDPRAGGLNDDDGVFWMSLTDMFQFFRGIDVCKHQRDWSVLRLADTFGGAIAPAFAAAASAASGSMSVAAVVNGGGGAARASAGSTPAAAAAAAAASASAVSPALSVNGSPVVGAHALPAMPPLFASNCMYELCVPASTWCVVSLIQNNRRGEPKSALSPAGVRSPGGSATHVYPDMGMFVVKAGGTQSRGLDACQDLKSFSAVAERFPESNAITHLDCMLTDTARRYLILPFSLKHTSQMLTRAGSGGGGGANGGDAKSAHNNHHKLSPTPFVLALYSANPIFVRRVPYWLPTLTIGTQLACARGAMEALGTWASIYTQQKGDCIVFVVVNRHATKHLSIELDCSASTGLVSSRGNLAAEDSIAPGHRQVLMVLTSINKYEGYSWSRRIRYIHRNTGDGHTPALLGAAKDLHTPSKV